MSDEIFMLQALAEAEKAAAAGEVPIGAVAVKNGMIAARAHNRVEELHSVTGHAEFQLLHALEKEINDWRMSDYTFYITKEPCPMCAGMIINSRVKRVVFGLKDPNGGAFGGAFDLNDIPGLLWHCEVSSGVLEEECKKIIQQFFQQRRNKEK